MSCPASCKRFAADLKADLQVDASIERWLERLDAMGSYGSRAAIRKCLDEAPEGARQTADYWYARGVVDARSDAENRDGSRA